MPRTISKEFESSQLVSHVDQRLAAALHARQIETIVRAESISEKAVFAIDIAVENVLMDVRLGKNVPAQLQKRFDEILNDILNSFVRLAYWSHGNLVDGYFQSIPTKWFKSLLPAETAIMFEDEGGIDDIDDISFDTPTEPIATDPNLTPEEKRDLIEKLVFPPPSTREVAEIISRPNSNTGTSWQSRFATLSKQITDNRAVFGELTTAFSSGETIDQMRERILPHVRGIRASAQRIARTEGLRVAERVQRRSWNGLGEMLLGVQILATLDENTRPHHAERNGTIYYKESKEGEKTLDEIPDLPDEPNCRCWSTPVLHPPQHFEDDPKVKKFFRTKSGAGIPDPASYDQWFSQADEGRRKMAVGVRRYNEVKKQLARIREPEWSDFIDETGKLLPLDQIKSETIARRQSRKVKVAAEIAARGDQRTEVSDRGFLAPRTTPTLVAGQTFTGTVNTLDNASMLGEIVRTRVAKGVAGQSEVSEIGRIIREYIYTDEIQILTKRLRTLQRRAEFYRKRRRLNESEKLQLAGLEMLLVQDWRKISKMKRERYLEIMSHIRDMGSENAYPTLPGSNEAIERLLNESQQYFPTDWVNEFHKTPTKTILVSRGFNDGVHIAVSDNGLGGRRSTMVHELIHQAERVIPGVSRTQKQHYDWRTKRNKLREISYAPGEFTRRDSWFGNRKNGPGEYMGKEYKSDHFEIATMGIEGVLFGTYPIEDDLKVYDLLLGILAVH